MKEYEKSKIYIFSYICSGLAVEVQIKWPFWLIVDIEVAIGHQVWPHRSMGQIEIYRHLTDQPLAALISMSQH